MLYFRPHRGSFDDSMNELKKFETFTQLVESFREELKPWNVEFSDEDISISPYTDGSRIGWPGEWIAVVKGFGVMGFVTHKD